MYIIISHYSNESIGEFDNIGVQPKAYATLDEAKAAADKLLREDQENGADHGDVIFFSSDESAWYGLPFDDPTAVQYCVGEELKDDFEVYHNLYAVFQVNMAG